MMNTSVSAGASGLNMPQQPISRKPRLRAIASSLTAVMMATIAVLLFLGIAASAVWRAFSADSFPPTPTIPANLESNFVYVSGKRGDVSSQPPGASEATALQVGDTIGAGSGALVRTGGDGWLRLGSAAGTFFLGAETEIELRQLGDERANRPETILQLNDGIMLLVADPDAGLRYVVFAETGARAETEVGMMGLTYDRRSQRFDLYCLRGPCWLIGREGETLELAAGEHGWVQGFAEPVIGEPFSYDLFLELADPGLVPTATPLPGRVTPVIAPTPALPTPTPVQLPPTEPPATFTPQPTPDATTIETTPTATATEAATTAVTEEATATAAASNTPFPTEAASATPPPMLPSASSTPQPTSTPPATATSLPPATLPPPTPASTTLPTTTATMPSGLGAPTATPASPG
jgi:hypothetical protein